MKNHKLFEMIEKYSALSNETTYQAPINIEYRAQHNRLKKFNEHFHHNLKAIINEMGPELIALKERNFDTKMIELFSKIYHNLISINKENDESNSYMGAEKLIHFTLEKPSGPIIDNLDFLAKHHLKQTNLDFKSNKIVGHPQISSLDLLKKLAIQLRDFIAKYPLIQFPSTIGLENNLKDVPTYFSGKEEETKS